MTRRDENWYLRNRSRGLIVSMFHLIRQLQVMNDFRNRDIIQIMANVYGDSNEDLVKYYLIYVVNELEKDDEIGRDRTRNKPRRPRNDI